MSAASHTEVDGVVYLFDVRFQTCPIEKLTQTQSRAQIGHPGLVLPRVIGMSDQVFCHFLSASVPMPSAATLIFPVDAGLIFDMLTTIPATITDMRVSSFSGRSGNLCLCRSQVLTIDGF
jgi:hypothetical protein